MSDPRDKSSTAIQNQVLTGEEVWFEYPVRAYPHHTDYGGVVWHGTYITWMEEARVECFKSIGLDYADLVALGCELLVVELSTRYHRAMLMGATGIVKTRMNTGNGVRLNWDYQIVSDDRTEIYLSAQVTLVAVDREKGKIMRRLPPIVSEAIDRLEMMR